MIKIKQKANNTKGFGFTITGGKEFNKPITVEKVSLGKWLGGHGGHFGFYVTFLQYFLITLVSAEAGIFFGT